MAMFAGAVLNAAAFIGGSYLAKSLSGDGGLEEKIRHAKVLEAYKRDMGAWEKKRTKYRDYLEVLYANKKMAEKNMK